MADLFEYLKWRGDLSFTQDPFNNVDSAILTLLSYIPFDNIVPDPSINQTITLKEAGEACLSLYNGDPSSRYFILKNDKPFLQALIDSPRFNSLQLSGYINKIDTIQEEQFSAVSIKLNFEELFVSYRGTDRTLVGWKEDFNMGFLSDLPAQKEAVLYLENAAFCFTGNIHLGGHSKGGNLAVYAGAFCSSITQKKIQSVYNFDGPGFGEDVILRQGYNAIVDRIKSFIPQDALVGLLLGNTRYSVVQSNQRGVMQHDLYSWNILVKDFVYLDTITTVAKIADTALKDFITKMSSEQRGKFVNAVYDIINSSKAESVYDIFKGKNFLVIMKSIGNLDESNKEVITQGIKLLHQSINKAVWNSLPKTRGFKRLEEKQKISEKRIKPQISSST